MELFIKCRIASKIANYSNGLTIFSNIRLQHRTTAHEVILSLPRNAALRSRRQYS